MNNSNTSTRTRIFISSTWLDLQAERQAVQCALDQMRDTEFIGMEFFGSRPDKPKEVCLQEVRRSNVYVGIFAHRYGYIDPESRLSMTELEYREAKQGGMPCLIYLADESAQAPDDGSETSTDGRTKLASLKQELMKEHVVTFFKNSDHLATKVILDLHNLLKEERLPEVVSSQITPAELRLIITMHFDLEELKTLCFDLGVDFDDLRGEGKSAKARELITYLRRRKQLDGLLALVKESRPGIEWN